MNDIKSRGLKSFDIYHINDNPEDCPQKEAFIFGAYLQMTWEGD